MYAVLRLYLTVSSICLYLALIPDIALLRDLGGKREWFYRILSLGWTGTENQHRRLEKAINFMSILVIPVMITVHTVVSFVFAMTIQPLVAQCHLRSLFRRRRHLLRGGERDCRDGRAPKGLPSRELYQAHSL